MTTVVPIRPEFAPPEIHARPVKIRGVWYQWLGPEPGRIPQGHRSPALGPRGKVVLSVGQVWVDLHTSMLWVIRSFTVVREHPSYPHQVTLQSYRGESRRIVSEMTLRQTMKVWEDALDFSRAAQGHVMRAARFDPSSPWRGTEEAVTHAQTFFGFDAYGNRQELVKARFSGSRGKPPKIDSKWRCRGGKLMFVINKHYRDKGHPIMISVTFLNVAGFGIWEYDPYDWHQQYVQVE